MAKTEESEIMSEARDKKMKRKRKLEEDKANRIMRACRFRRYDEIRWAFLLCSKKFYYIIITFKENVIELKFRVGFDGEIGSILNHLVTPTVATNEPTPS